MNKSSNKKIITVCIVLLAVIAIGTAIFFAVRNRQSTDSSGSLNNNSDITIYYVRHGRTDANENKILAGCKTDAHLTKDGEEKTKKTGQYLSDIAFNKVYTSELTRTKQTADIIMAENKNGIPRFITEPLLNDVDWGQAEGLAVDDAIQKFPEFTEDNYLGKISDSAFVSPIGASSKYNKVADFENALNTIVNDSNKGDKILVVGHSSFSWLLQKMFPDKVKEAENLPNSSVTVLTHNGSTWELRDFAIDFN